MENKTVYGVGRFRSQEFFSLFSSEVKRTSCLSILLSLLLSLVLVAVSLGVVSFERMGRYQEKAEVLRGFIDELGEERFAGAINADLQGNRMVKAVNEGETLFLQERFDAMKEIHGLVGLSLTREGQEVFRAGDFEIPEPRRAGWLFSRGRLLIGKTFILTDGEGREHSDLRAYVWLDMSQDVLRAERFAQDRYSLSVTPQAGAISVIPGIWLIRPTFFQVLASLREDQGLILVFLGQTLCVFVLCYVGLSLLSQREGQSQRVISLAGILEEKDPYTMGHSDRVAHYAEKIGREMGVRGMALKKLILAARTHDLGKIFVPAEILGKRGSLTHREWLHIWRHSVDSERIFLKLFPNRRVARIVRSHHERWDGRGYPDGLAGAEIPLESRVIAVADSFDTMTTKRPYRDAMAVERALRAIEENAGSQFDPEVARKAQGVLREMCAERIAEERLPDLPAEPESAEGLPSDLSVETGPAGEVQPDPPVETESTGEMSADSPDEKESTGEGSSGEPAEKALRGRSVGPVPGEEPIPETLPA